MPHETKNPSHSSEFDAGSFTIPFLSPSDEGFEFETRNAIGRTESFAEGQKVEFADEQRERLARGMRGEMRFNGAPDVRHARDMWREAIQSGATAENIDRLHDAYEQSRTGYINRGKKVGLRAIQATGNTLSADVQLVQFPVYNEFANPQNSPEILELSSATGVAMIVRTADNRIVIQHRAIEKPKLHEKKSGRRGNASFADIPGASVAGMFDATLKGADRKPGTPDPINTGTLKGAILKEASEELGLGPEHFNKMRIVGVAEDKVKIHDEILFLADTDLTASQLHEASRSSKRNKNLGDADFEEKFIDIEGTPQAVETLLTEVHCPLPPTHAAALVAAGYSLMLQDHGLQAANEWKQHIETGVRANYRHMDKMVADYYHDFPEAADHVPERYWGKNVPIRNLSGYTPAYGPEEQGLPSFEDEMTRTGLMPETRKPVAKGYMFDVDGVLSHPVEKRVTDEGLYDELAKRIASGEPVALNTGRSTEWVMERFVTPLLEKVTDKNTLRNLVVIGEKGGTWTTFGELGVAHHGKSESLVVSDDLKKRIIQLVSEKYSDAMFFDETKETMISVEMHDGFDMEAFTARQAEFVADANEILRELGQEQKYNVDPTTIATDIESPHVGKALGADRFLEFLKAGERSFYAAEFVAFGDSDSDLEMADELERRRLHVEFVYVGNNPDAVQARGRSYSVKTEPGFTRGTLTYLTR